MKESGVHDSLTAEDREIASLMQGGTTMPVIMSYHPPQTKLATTTNSVSQSTNSQSRTKLSRKDTEKKNISESGNKARAVYARGGAVASNGGVVGVG